MEKITEKQFTIFINDILDYLENYIDIANIYKNYKETEYILTSKNISYLNLENGDSYKLFLEEGSGKTILPMLLNEEKFYFGKQRCFVKETSYGEERLKNIMFHELMHVGSRNNYTYGKYDICTKTGIYSIRLIKNKTNKEYEYLNEALTEFVAKFIYDDLYSQKYKIIYEYSDKLLCSAYEKGYFILAFLLYNYFKENPKDLFEIYFNNNEEFLDNILRKNTIYTLETLNNLIDLFQNKSNKEINDYYNDLIKNIYYNNPIKNIEIVKQYNL